MARLTWRRQLTARVPQRLKGRARSAQRAATLATARLRVLPDFLIIGAQRCGTTSLYRYLAGHPGVAAPVLGKGAHYFDTNFEKGEAWYRAHFPTRVYKDVVRRSSLITGEGSPYYIFHPHAPRRIAELLPDVKVVAMLRDPVARAYSHYWHEVARGFEALAFEEAIEQEPARVDAELERMLEDPSYKSWNHQHYSYLSRGLYADQLERWYAVFPRERMLILSSERFFADTDREYRRVLEFLGLPPTSLVRYDAFNPREYSGMSVETERRLTEYFASPNQRLYELLGVDLGWRRTTYDGVVDDATAS